MKSGAPRTTGKRRKQEPGEVEWKLPRYGRCKNCNTYGVLLLHHVLPEQEIRKLANPDQIAAGICWDQRNALALGAPYVMGGKCQCHAGHHHPGTRDTRIDFAKVPGPAVLFARELMGDGPAAIFFARRYSNAVADAIMLQVYR